MADHMHKPLIDPISGETIDDPVIFYHAPCPDGFCAALAAWLHFEGRGEYIGISHEQRVPDVHGRPVYMLDIAFERNVMERVESQASRFVVLDHHEGAANGLEGFECRCGLVHFDMTKSAARICWETFQPGKPVPELVEKVEDRDLLQWMIEDAPDYLMALDVGPRNFHRWAGIIDMPPDARERFMARGKAMREMSDKMSSQLADHALPIELCGVKGLMANAGMVFHNDVGAKLIEKCGTFAAVWCVEQDANGKSGVRVGLRAGSNVDLIPIAKAFGGNGHANSARFRLPLERIGELMSGTLEPDFPMEQPRRRSGMRP